MNRNPLMQPHGAAIVSPAPAPILERMRAKLARIQALPANERARYSRDESELEHLIKLAVMLEDERVPK